MEDRIQNKLKDMPMSYRNTYKKALAGKNRAAGVKAFCLECMGWDRIEVRKCCSVACPLFPYRPYS